MLIVIREVKMKNKNNKQKEKNQNKNCPSAKDVNEKDPIFPEIDYMIFY